MAIGTGLAILGSALIGGVASNSAAKKGAKAVKQGQDATIAENARQFDLVRSDTAPIRALGANATALLSRLYGYSTPGTPAAAPELAHTQGLTGAGARIAGRVLGRDPVTIDGSTGQPIGGTPGTPAGVPDMTAFFESPDYQFNLAEGQKAIDRSLIARHGGLSGAAVKEGIRFASGSASREYGSFVDRLMQQAGLGSNGTSQSAAAGANAAGNISAANMNAANARTSIYGNNAANINNAAQGAISNWMLSQYLKPPTLPPGGTSGGTPPIYGS